MISTPSQRRAGRVFQISTKPIIELLERRQLLAAGDLDGAFSDDGLLTGAGTIADSAVLSNGKIVTAGVADSISYVRRFNADGTVDTDFGGGDGIITSPMVARGIEVLPSGHILLAGSHNDAFAVAKLNSDGSIDPTFGGGDGIATGQFRPPGAIQGERGSAHLLAIDSEGRIVATGDAGLTDDDSTFQSDVIARFSPTGAVDTSFGFNGHNAIPSSSRGSDITGLDIDAQDRPVFVSYFHEQGPTSATLHRLTESGQFDSSFSGDGRVDLGLELGGTTGELAIQSDGDIVFVRNHAGSVGPGLHAYSSEGTEEASTFDIFGHHNDTQFVALDTASRLTLLPDDRIVVTGMTFRPGAPDDFGIGSELNLAVNRFAASGAPDTSFRGGEPAFFDLGNNDEPFAIAYDPATDGIVVAGQGEHVHQDPPPDAFWFITRLQNEGGSAQRSYGVRNWTVDETIEAEHFDVGGPGVSFSDTTAANEGEHYRNTGADIYRVSGLSNHHVVGLTRPGEWLEFSVVLPQSGTFNFQTRYATPASQANYHFEVDGVNVTGTRNFARTGRYETYATATTNNFSLSAGTHVVRLFIGATNAVGTAANLDWIRLNQVSGTPGQTPFKDAPIPVNQTIEAEDFDNGGQDISFSDSTTTNEGGAYRSTGVDIYAVSGASNAHVVGLTRPGEWLEYTINVTQAGNYAIQTRYATPASTANYHYEIDGVNVTGTRNFARTGAYETYATANTNTFSLSEGLHVLRLFIGNTNVVGTAANIDWIRVNQASTPTPTQTPFKGTPFVPDQIIEGEDFDNGGQNVSFLDTTTANEGGAYRSTAVDLYTVSGASNGHVVGLTRPSEWLEYTVTVAEAGTYSFDTRYATPATTAAYQYQIDGANVTNTLNFNRTGAYETYATTRTPTFNLSAGTHVVRLFIGNTNAPGTAANIDWIRLNRHTTSTNQTPFHGTPFAVNTTIQAEDFDKGGQGVAFNDADTTNKGGKYRLSEGVDIETTGDTGGGFNVGYTTPGEWLEYTINVPTTGEYDIQTRLGAVQSGALHYEVDGQTRATVNITPTAGFQSYTTLTHSLGTLTAGTHVLRLQFDSTNGSRGVANINWLKIVPGSTQGDTQAPSAVPNFRMEWMNFHSFNQYHLTWDAASDNVGVAGYRITYNFNSRFDGTFSQTVNLGPDARSFDAHVSDIHHNSDFKIAAFDAAGNLGPFVDAQPGGARGLVGNYYNNTDFTDLAFSRFDANINFDWGTGAPDDQLEPPILLQPDTFSVEWFGRIDIPTSGTYTFWASADDRARLLIDGVQVVNFIPGSTPNSGTINLTPGKHRIEYEYVEFTGNARAKLEWAGPGFSRQVVPGSVLFVS